MPVSRETPETSTYFTDPGSWQAINRYVDMLATVGLERGLIGPREVERLWDRHVLNSVVVTPRLAEGADVADVGSGAGLPGVVWAIARPDVRLTLIEPLLRRTTFLTEVVDELTLSNVTVMRARAEDVTAQFDVVTARAVAPLERLARWCLPLIRDGGVLLALKGQRAPEEVEAARGAITRLGGTDMVIETYGDGSVPTTVVEVSR